MKKKVEVFAPATVANVSCGFDVLGFPIENLGDRVILTENNTNNIKITKIYGVNNLSYDCKENIVGHVIIKMLEYLKITKIGIDIELYKGIAIGSGLGSSSASSVAACFALNEFLDNPFTTNELIPFAMEGERLATGVAHADNVAPSLNGGFNLIRSYNPIDVVPFSSPSDLYCTVIHPNIEVKTELSRNILKKNILLKDAVTQWGNLSGLTIGLITKDYSLISRALNDVIIEPTRSILIPKYQEIKEQCIAIGGLGCGISGSGPSIFCLSKGEKKAEEVRNTMGEIFKETKIGYNIYVSKVSSTGAYKIL